MRQRWNIHNLGVTAPNAGFFGSACRRASAGAGYAVMHRLARIACVATFLLVLVAPVAAEAATMQVEIFISGKGSVTGPDSFSCSNGNPDPAQVRDCDNQQWSMCDFGIGCGVPEKTFTAT